MNNNINKIQDKIDQLGEIQPWNHNFELPDGLYTSRLDQKSHGKNLVKFSRLSHIFDLLDLNEKKVLDMGCNEGFFSLKMSELGAYVHGVDIDKERIKKANFIKEIINSSSKIEYSNLDIYSKEFNEMNIFDICLCLGFIHRVPDPYSAVEAISSKANIIIFEWKALKFGSHDESFAYFSDKNIDEDDYYGTEYWIISYKTLERILNRLGFKNFHRIDDPRQRRAILIAGKVDHPIFDLHDVIFYRNKIRTFLSHTKRYLAVIYKIMIGKING
tara:strand:- start:2959 stop:3777 length:819 start_codon:yes stop_codon:yes gene_type:complete